MPKIRKVRRKKKFRHLVNRKKLNQRRKKLPKIACNVIEESWNPKQTMQQNLEAMGLASDPNVSVAIPKRKNTLLGIEEPAPENSKFPRLAVALQLEKESKERKRKTLRLPQMVVDRLGYFIQKYGDDYQAMTRDRMNYDQHTWKQLRAQIKKFMGIPEQWEKYWKVLGMEPPNRCITIHEDENMDD